MTSRLVLMKRLPMDGIHFKGFQAIMISHKAVSIHPTLSMRSKLSGAGLNNDHYEPLFHTSLSCFVLDCCWAGARLRSSRWTGGVVPVHCFHQPVTRRRILPVKWIDQMRGKAATGFVCRLLGRMQINHLSLPSVSATAEGTRNIQWGYSSAG